jgi:CMP-N-acetylneuraminic acid synthetase/spore coat polysaccharide biosynthesis predicted glycosyltransferase SpsG
LNKFLLIIPARGKSKGIPRKNIRNLGGHPLIYYSIQTALNSKYNLDVYVTSDDDEILHISNNLGAKVHKRMPEYSADDTTLDPVIHNAYKEIQIKDNCKYDYVITLQPTSPILKSSSLDQAIEKIIANNIDTIISAKEDSHLAWSKQGEYFIPEYTKRLNRQYLNPTYRETGGFVITKSEYVKKESRFGKKVDLFILSDGEEIDIDDYHDWSICEYYLKRKNILFVVTGNKTNGLGHVYNSLIIANDLTEHNIEFLLDKNSDLGYSVIKDKNYKVSKQNNRENLIDAVLRISPDILINEKLDNDVYYIKEIRKHGIRVINFEDRGESGKHANMVINAIYSSKEFRLHYYYGFQYYLLRDEFNIKNHVKIINNVVSNVLIVFGGTDPNNLTLKTLDSIYNYCRNNNIVLNIISGLGYEIKESILSYNNINIYNDVKNISDYMIEADIIFSAMGRTVYEIASLGIPTILMAQNKRELSHTFGYGQNGFINLGEGKLLNKKKIEKEFISLVENYDIRKQMNRLMRQYDLRSGRARVLKLITEVIEE